MVVATRDCDGGEREGLQRFEEDEEAPTLNSSTELWWRWPEMAMEGFHASLCPAALTSTEQEEPDLKP